MPRRASSTWSAILRVRPGVSCRLLSAAALAFVLAGTAAAQPGTIFNRGLVINELHHSQSLFVGPAGPLPSYIEILNRDKNSTVSPPLQVGAAGAQLRCQRNGIGDAVASIPPGITIPSRGILVIAAQPLPNIPLAVPGIAASPQQIVATSFFVNGVGQNLEPCRPGVAQRFCLNAGVSPATASPPDRIDVEGPVFQPPCQGNFTAAPQLPFIPNPVGHVNRVLFVDSDTYYDFDGGVSGIPPVPPATLPTPGYIDNPPLGQTPPSQGMDHVNGLLFGPGPAGLAINVPNPVPFPNTAASLVPFFVGGISPTTVTGNIGLSGAPVGRVSVPHHPRFPVIGDPLFDRILDPAQGQLVCQAQVQGVDPLLAQTPASPAILAMNWNVTVPPSTAGGQPGVLTIDMATMIQMDVRFSIAGATTNLAGRPRIERILSDNTADTTATVTGEASGVQIDMVPESTGTGDIWCDVIIYDESGFSYRAKVRNWPSNPTQCNTRNLGLGSNAIGNIDIIALCFTPQPTSNELYILPSLTIFSPTGGGPFMGLMPDGLTLAALTMPLGVNPYHVQTTVDGLYFYSLTNGGLSGLVLDIVAVEYVPLTGFVSPFPAATITIN